MAKGKLNSDAVDESPVFGAMVNEYRITSVGKGPLGVECIAADTKADGNSFVVLSFVSELVRHAGDTALRGILTEARAAAVFQHTGVLRLQNIGRTPAGIFFATEFFDAPGAGEVLARCGPMSPYDATAIVRDISWILQAVHAAGLTHRDIKPDNILVGGDGQVRLARLEQTRVLEELQQFKLGLRLVPATLSTTPSIRRRLHPRTF